MYPMEQLQLLINMVLQLLNTPQTQDNTGLIQLTKRVQLLVNIPPILQTNLVRLQRNTELLLISMVRQQDSIQQILSTKSEQPLVNTQITMLLDMLRGILLEMRLDTQIRTL
jgi:hypothetical protein